MLIIPSSLARQGFEDYSSGKLSLFLFLPHRNEKIRGSSRLCVISLTYIVAIDLCVLCVSVVRSTPSPARLYLRIHFTHQTGESRSVS
ncbi:hypothetical protein MICAK_2710003 [Microcystis aeruginosa PCC 9701]|uniref:Uncharacterized protein n=1 Tax=Microcystis aeruginosa PCC 9701 TaxID=721123 RepID=I4IR62_MICAE|nr:hypothetical protein MICAK_2710003 [Microcystis aeruginosa PCC 9701]